MTIAEPVRARPAEGEARQRDAEQTEATLAALQAALAAEHAAVYGYGVVGGRVDEERRDEARQAHDAHRARRDALHRTVHELGGRPRAAAAAYQLPFEVPDGAAAVRLAAELEDRVAGVYADLVRVTTGARRREAAAALREAAVRSARWKGSSVAFPGLAERQSTSTTGPSTPAGEEPRQVSGVDADGTAGRS